MAAKLTKAKQEKIVKEAKQAADNYFSGFARNIEKYKEQLKFWLVMKEQWSSDERSLLTQFNKIPLVCPKIYGIARRILGEQRQSTPDMRVFATTEKASPEAIALRDDWIRTTCLHSDAHVAYQTAYRSVLFGGFGAFKVITKYEKPNSFDQCLQVVKVDDPTLCFFDLTAVNFAKDDGMFSGEYKKISKEKFKAKHPEVDVEDYEILPGSGYTMSSESEVAIIIYQRKEYFSKIIIQLTTGEVVDLAKYEEMVNEYIGQQKEIRIEKGVAFDPLTVEVPEELKIAKRRKVRDYKIRTYKIAGKQVFEHATWPSKYFGYVFVDGDSTTIDGRQVCKPFFEDAQDLQRVGNWTFTQINHLMKAIRNEGWLASPENITGYEDIWTNPELTQSALIANPDERRGGAMPIQIQPTQVSNVLIQQYDGLMQNINSTLGIYDAYEGNKGGEISGVAIDNRVKQGNLATFIVNSNLNRAVGHAGKVMLDAFPRIYDTKRTVTLKSRDGDTKTVVLNDARDGQIFNDTQGEEYYIEIDAGSSFEGQKQEALQSLRELFQINPATSTLAADLFAENLPLQNAQIIVKRLRAGLVPPEIVAAGKGEELPPKEPPPPPPELVFMEKTLELQEQKQNMDAQAKAEEIRLKQERLDLEREKEEFKAYIGEQNLNLKKVTERAKLGIY